MKRRWLPDARPGFDFYVLAAGAFALPGVAIGALLANRPSPVLLIPVVAAVIPFIAKRWGEAFCLRLLSGVLFGVIAVLGLFTIGILFVPSAGLALAGAVVAAANSVEIGTPMKSDPPGSGTWDD